MEELWKPVNGYENIYFISNKGRIKNINTNYFLKAHKTDKFGHTQTCLCNGIEKRFYISRLVAIHFIDNPLNLPLVLHKDETLDENGCLYNGEDNLFWGTYKDNAQDCHRKGRSNNYLKKIKLKPWLGKFGKNNHSSKTLYQYSLDGKFQGEGGSTSEVKRILGFNQSNISACCRGKRNHVGGFIWKYKNK